MKDYLVLSLVGADRTGLVDRITGAILSAHGNVEESRMAVLGGEFAMLMLVGVPASFRKELEESVRQAADELSLVLQMRPTTARRAVPEAVPMTVQVQGMDHEGIVYDVVHYLADQGISVETLDSQITCAPHTGTPLFTMNLGLEVPPAISLQFLERGLDAVADRLNVSVSISATAVEEVRV